MTDEKCNGRNFLRQCTTGTCRRRVVWYYMLLQIIHKNLKVNKHLNLFDESSKLQ
jgi:hypothetical protein